MCSAHFPGWSSTARSLCFETRTRMTIWQRSAVFLAVYRAHKPEARFFRQLHLIGLTVLAFAEQRGRQLLPLRFGDRRAAVGALHDLWLWRDRAVQSRVAIGQGFEIRTRHEQALGRQRLDTLFP